MNKFVIAALSCSLIMVQPASAGIALSATASGLSNISAPVVPAVAGGQFAKGNGAAEVIDVRWRGHRHYHRHRRHRGGGGVGAFGAGLAVGIVGALIANGISESAARDRFARCEAEFRSFDPETGTYITHRGEERLCPYLR